MLSCIYSRTAERNCLKNPDGLHFGVSVVGKTRREAPLLPLCDTKDTQSRASSYLPNSFSRKLAEQARLPTPWYRIGRRAYASGFPRRTLLGRTLKLGRVHPPS